MTEAATAVAGYLRRIGLGPDLPPTLGTLTAIHRHHLAAVPYENLEIMLGRPPSTDPRACLERVVEVGRAGYCFHQNGALEVVLRELGFAVQRRHGQVLTDDATPRGSLNHLVLVVSGLPTPENPGGRWWPDAGLGDAFVDPLPLVEGEHVQDGFRYRLEDVSDDGWLFRHDPTGTFTDLHVTDAPVGEAEVLAAHRHLATPPDGRFTQVLAVLRRDSGGVDVLRGCVRSRVEPGGTVARDELTSYDAWRAGLVELRVGLADVAEEELRDLFERSLAVHRAWVAEGRP